MSTPAFITIYATIIVCTCGLALGMSFRLDLIEKQLDRIELQLNSQP